MHAAKKYVANATTEHALHHMLAATAATSTLAPTIQEITRYVEQKLTPEEQRICDMATD